MTRRVTTGHDAAGSSVFLADEKVAAITLSLMPGMEFRHLFTAQQPPTVPNDGVADDRGPYFPRPGGVRVSQVVFPPASAGGGVPPDLEAAAAEVEVKLPGMLGALETDDPGMHTTDAVDVGIVAEGELWLELDDGQEKHLTAGDVVIQNGTRHRWHNRSDRPCVVTYVLVGAHRR